MADKLMAGVSGIRGVVGEGITPPVIQRYAAAFAAVSGPGPIVFGRDSRPSGETLRHAALAGLLGAGRDVLEVGIVPTPTVQIEVERHHAAGGLALTASHNPIEWNALKFVGSDGRFLAPQQAAQFLTRAEAPVSWVRWDALGHRKEVPDALQHHVDRILGLSEVDPAGIARAGFRVVVDAVHGAGGAIARRLLEALGVEFTILYEEPTGMFPREPEPLAEHLGALAREVVRQGADVGFAFDPDVDRLSLVDETGRALGEEFTLALAADHVLSLHPGPVVTNRSTSARLDWVAARHGVQVTRTPVGEANVVQGILDTGARIGGEGNGGVILPAFHLGRDAPGGVALILSGLAARERSLARWAGGFPPFFMTKEKWPVTGEPDWEALRRDMLPVMGPGGGEDRRDGLWMGGEREWIHVRKSGTEPVVRVIAEAQSSERAMELAQAVRAVLG